MIQPAGGLQGMARMLTGTGGLAVPPRWTSEDGYVPGPAAGPEGAVVTGRGGQVAALDAKDGSPRWSRDVGPLAGPPVTAEDRSLAATRDGRVVCLDAEGEVRWDVPVADSLEEAPLPAPGGRVLVRTPKGHLHSLGPDGSTLWKQDVGGRFERGPRPAVGPDGTVYCVTFSNATGAHLHALAADSGAPRWSHGLGGATPHSLATGDDGRIYVGYTVGRVTALEGDGRFLWHADAGGPDSHASVRVAPGFASTDAGRLYALDPEGKPIWAREIAPGRLSAPVRGPEGDVLLADAAGRVYSVDESSGAVRWRTDLDRETPRAAAQTPVAAGQSVVTIDGEGRLHAVAPRLTLEEMAADRTAPQVDGIVPGSERVTIGGITLPVNQ